MMSAKQRSPQNSIQLKSFNYYSNFQVANQIPKLIMQKEYSMPPIIKAAPVQTLHISDKLL